MNRVHLQYHVCFICIVIFTHFINNISFIDSVRPNNTIVLFLFPSAFTISLKLFIPLKIIKIRQSPLKRIYFCLPNLICNKISKSCVELMGHFILSNK